MYTFHTVILLVNTLDRPRKHTMLSWQYINPGKASQCFIRVYCLIARKYILQLQSIFVIYGTRTWTLSSLFSRIAAQTTILSMVYHCHNFVLSNVWLLVVAAWYGMQRSENRASTATHSRFRGVPWRLLGVPWEFGHYTSWRCQHRDVRRPPIP